MASCRQASATARPNRYCTKTSLEAGRMARDVRRSSENVRHPDGESHTLVPRPRPVSCWEARDRIGEGRRDVNVGFLGRIYIRRTGENLLNILVKHGLGARHDLAIKQRLAHCPGDSIFMESVDVPCTI